MFFYVQVVTFVSNKEKKKKKKKKKKKRRENVYFNITKEKQNENISCKAKMNNVIISAKDCFRLIAKDSYYYHIQKKERQKYWPSSINLISKVSVLPKGVKEKIKGSTNDNGKKITVLYHPNLLEYSERKRNVLTTGWRRYFTILLNEKERGTKTEREREREWKWKWENNDNKKNNNSNGRNRNDEEKHINPISNNNKEIDAYIYNENNTKERICLTKRFLNDGKLNAEILDVHTKLTENSCIQKKKEEIYFLLKTAISPNLKGKIYFVGSCENNIWINNSDIDCCVVVENCDDKNSSLYILQLIKSAINLIYPSLTIRIIKASVPIAKIYKGNINICDISINNTVAIVNTQLVTSLCQVDERVAMINRIIKYWAKQKNINNRSQGTFSSYALFLLTYFFFQNLEVPLLPSYKSIERQNANSFEINSQYFFLQDEVQMPFYTDKSDIQSKFPYYEKNKEELSTLLYGFFEYYSSNICKNGITLDVYNNQLIENKGMTANICCPITKKIVNTYSINTWKNIFDKLQTAYMEMKNGNSLHMICEEIENSTPNRGMNLKENLTRRRCFLDALGD